MRRTLIAAIAALAAGTAAYAQDPARQNEPNAEHPPTNRMNQATPTMKAPGASRKPHRRGVLAKRSHP
jgi:hypothetical protein